MKNRIKLILAASSVAAMTTSICALSSCSCDNNDNSVVLTTKNVELNDETIGTNTAPIIAFDFTISNEVKTFGNVEITSQKHTGGLFKNYGSDFEYHTKVEIISTKWDKNTKKGQFEIRFSEGVLNKGSQVTFNIKATYTDVDDIEHSVNINDLVVTNQLNIWEKIDKNTIEASSSKEQTFSIYCYGFSAGRSWDVALINGTDAEIEVGKDKFTTHSYGGSGSENGYITATTTFIQEFIDKYKSTTQKFYFACQPTDGGGYETEPVYIVPYSLSFK